MESKFNPSSPEYKNVEDLPQEHQAGFADVGGMFVRSGFARKEAVETMSEAEKLAAIANELKGIREKGVTGVDVLHGKALEEENDQERKEKLLAMVKRHGGNLEHASNELKNDKEVVFAAVKNFGDALEYASEDLKNDKDVVLAAISGSYGEALRYASEDLKNDKDVVLAAVKYRNSNLEYASEKLQEEVKKILE